MTYIQIGNYAPPFPPTDYSVRYSSKDSAQAQENERGIFKPARLRNNVMEISVKYRLRITDIEKLAAAIDPPQFTAKCFDLTSAKIVTKTMRVTEKHAEIVKYNRPEPTKMWIDYTFTLIEC